MLNNTDESNVQDTNDENYNLGLVEFSIHNNTDGPNVPEQTPYKSGLAAELHILINGKLIANNVKNLEYHTYLRQGSKWQQKTKAY